MIKATRIRVRNLKIESANLWIKIATATIGDVKKKFRLDGVSDGHGNVVGWELNWIRNAARPEYREINRSRRDTAKVWVNIYEVCRAYGGPEEGGWWYDHRNCIKSIKLPSNRYANYIAKKLRSEGEYKDTGRPNHYNDSWYEVDVEAREAASQKLYDWYE